MTALAAARRIREERWKFKEFTLASGNIAYQGGSACLDLSAGKVVPASAAEGLLHIGVFAETVDATAADASVGVNLVEEIALVWYANAGSGTVASTDLGQVCYFADDQTVTMTGAGGPVAGRVWAVDTSKGVAVQKLGAGSADTLAVEMALEAFVANDSTPNDIVHGAIYEVGTTGGASTVTLPAAAVDGTVAYFVADGVANGHTVQYRDATGPTNLTTALTASKRHLVVATKTGGAWFCNAYISP
jgi:hypothetical protein